jgi:hypothetical protein
MLMQTSHHFLLYDRAIRTKIGDALRTLFVPTEPTPMRLKELLRALDEPKGGDTREEESGKDKTGGSETVPPDSDVTEKRSACVKQHSDSSENEHVEKIPDGYVVWNADGQALVYLFCGADETDALQANVLTEDEARQIAINVARLPRPLKRNG